MSPDRDQRTHHAYSVCSLLSSLAQPPFALSDVEGRFRSVLRLRSARTGSSLTYLYRRELRQFPLHEDDVEIAVEFEARFVELAAMFEGAALVQTDRSKIFGVTDHRKHALETCRG